jgi:hypothetical protein
MSKRTVTNVIVQDGSNSAGNTTDATWRRSHAKTAYAAATLNTFRLLSSAQNDTGLTFAAELMARTISP